MTMNPAVLSGLFLILSSCSFHPLKALRIPSAAETPPPACETAEVGFVCGRTTVPKNRLDLSGEKIDLYFEHTENLRSAKDVIIIMNGGPGGNLKMYNQNPLLRELAQSSALFFYDQRGTGRSHYFSATNSPAHELKNYRTSDNIEDLEDLRKNVIRRDRVILLGHSYGAHLALGYAAKYPNQIQSLIALNGGADSLGFLLQSSAKHLLLEKLLTSYSETEQIQLLEKLQSGKGKYVDESPIDLTQFLMRLTMELSTYLGQTKRAPELLESMIEINVRQKTKPKLSSNKTENAPSSDVIGINQTINDFITCHDLYTRTAMSALSPDQEKAALISKEQLCARSPLKTQEIAFDVKNELHRIHARTLLIGGRFDPLIPFEVQARDYKILSATNPKTVLVEFTKSGHQSLDEDSACASLTLKRFLAGTLTDGNWTCEDGKLGVRLRP